jgi:hypothetical protein
MPIRWLVEFSPMVAAVLLAWLLPSISPRWWAAPSRLLRLLAGNNRSATLWSAVLTFAASAALYAVLSPAPRVHDEFAYLLASDTYSRGRLTNPTHPLWEHFESFHVFHTPTYQAKYPPGQGLFLAAGQALTGRPIVGVWLGMAAGAAAVCWMLLAWLPPRWALFGALLPVLRFGTIPVWYSYRFVYWSTSYWGGAVAMAGGALLLGALPRLLKAPRPKDAVAMGVGLVLLANSRPYEGLVVALPAGLLLLTWMLARHPPWRTVLFGLVLPATGVLALGALSGAYYNFRVTGDALRLPYQVHSEQYDVIPMFTFQPLQPAKTYRHDALYDQYGSFMVQSYEQKIAGPAFFLGFQKFDFDELYEYYLGLALWVPLVWLLGRPWDPWAAFFCALIVLTLLASSISAQTTLLEPHYFAAVAPGIIYLVVAGLRRARTLRLAGRRVGRALAEAIVLLCLVSAAVGSIPFRLLGNPYETPVTIHRPAIQRRLEASGGKHLIVVTFGPDHNMVRAWVANGADLDGAAVVWARDMGPEKNRRLVEYYRDRQIWRLYADEDPPRLEPYEEAGNER